MNDKADTSEVVELLKSYRVYEQQFFAEKYARTFFFDPYATFHELNGEECQEKMDYIKNLIAGLPVSNARTLLNLHYINGLPIEKCAECMMMARASTFRLLRRALVAVNNRYQRMKGGAECTSCAHFVGCETACGGRICDEYKEKNE